MKAINNKPIFSRSYNSVSDFNPECDSCYIYGESVEERSAHIEAWRHKCSDTDFVKIIKEDFYSFEVDAKPEPLSYSLRSSRQLANFVSNINKKIIYLDITGLSHSTWASLVKYMLLAGLDLRVIYVEPFDYRPSLAPTEGDIFDLSVKIQGIAPIPGFACLSDDSEDNVCFIPLLGFEGARFYYVMEQVQPPGEKIVPVVGVPGFKPEYPYNAYLGNKIPLRNSQSYRNVRFATANCPFSLFYLLEDISADYPNDRLAIAPIGTKPHALGAVLFALLRPNTELVYDHPIRKPKRTEGTACLHSYYLGVFTSLIGKT